MGNDPDQLLTTAEVARIFRVNERTIRRWTASGDLDDCLVRTPGGKYRYRETVIRRRATPSQTSRPGGSQPPQAGPGPTTETPGR